INDPVTTSISGLIQLESGQNISLTFRPAGTPGSFSASVTLPALDEVAEGVFVLRESGALPQVIPISLAVSPKSSAKAGGAEIFDFGVQQEVLNTISHATGGIDLSLQVPDVGRIASEVRYSYLYPWLILLAVTFLAIALWAEGRRTN
ncbi:MAG: hypothetical protein KUG70_01795, partial [Rhodobacteraceae bacterium]|nr:hypothetical protein [Paracoccaceae bacterium]